MWSVILWHVPSVFPTESARMAITDADDDDGDGDDDGHGACLQGLSPAGAGSWYTGSRSSSSHKALGWCPLPRGWSSLTPPGIKKGQLCQLLPANAGPALVLVRGLWGALWRHSAFHILEHSPAPLLITHLPCSLALCYFSLHSRPLAFCSLSLSLALLTCPYIASLLLREKQRARMFVSLFEAKSLGLSKHHFMCWPFESLSSGREEAL